MRRLNEGLTEPTWKPAKGEDGLEISNMPQFSLRFTIFDNEDDENLFDLVMDDTEADEGWEFQGISSIDKCKDLAKEICTKELFEDSQLKSLARKYGAKFFLV